jgi:hypothetical protein
MTTLRSVLFLLGALLITTPYGFIVPAGRIFHRRGSFIMARSYTRVMLKWVEVSLGTTR